MANITDPVAVRFSNQALRTIADELAAIYAACKERLLSSQQTAATGGTIAHATGTAAPGPTGHELVPQIIADAGLCGRSSGGRRRTSAAPPSNDWPLSRRTPVDHPAKPAAPDSRGRRGTGPNRGSLTPTMTPTDLHTHLLADPNRVGYAALIAAAGGDSAVASLILHS